MPDQKENALTFMTLSVSPAPSRREMRLLPPMPNRFAIALSMKNSTKATETAATM